VCEDKATKGKALVQVRNFLHDRRLPIYKVDDGMCPWRGLAGNRTKCGLDTPAWNIKILKPLLSLEISQEEVV